MAEFTSSPQVSPTPNQLFNPLMAGQQQAQTNQLQMQQLDLSAADHEQVGRLAAGLLNEPDVAKRADLYARGVGMLQSQGLAKYAPPTLPDEGVLRSLVNQSVPVADQYKMGLITPPGLTDALSRSNAPLPGQPGYGGAPGAAPAAGGGGDFGTKLAQSESGGKSSVINPQGYTGLFQFGKQRLADLGYYTPASGEDMADNRTWAGKVSIPGFNVTDQQSFANNPAAQRVAFATHLGNIDQAIANTPGANRFDPNGLRAVAHLGGVDGMQRFVASGGAYSPGDANGTTLASYYQRFSGGAPQAPAGGVGTPSRVQVASAAPTVPVTATDGTTAPPGPPAVSAPAPGATTTAAAPAATVAPASTAQPAPATGTGTQSPQFQAALEMNRRATALETQFPYSPQAKAQAASLRAQAALYMQADSVIQNPDGTQTKQLTGERLNAAAPLAHYVWNQDQGAYVDTTGVHPPVTPPSPRLTQTKGGDILQSKPGGGATVVYSTNPQDVATQAAAQAQGSGVGGDVAKQLPAMISQARNAAQQEGQIDYASNQLREAAKGGIPTGYFSDALATAAAAAKSLGIDTSSLGVNPEAVGNMQTAQKTLSVIGGAIIRQALGPGSAITDGKVEQFIHTQPGIQNDPQALQRIMAWARSQYTYEREMGQAAVAEAAKSPTGTLPLSWQAQYYRDHGFAPIYDPVTQEMRQPDGRQPERETPPAVSTARVPREGDTATGKDGHKIVLRGGQWVPQ